tara:strand:- start:5154 stop:7628 length:2475 start_codon:yes stop_codon:yes gene_type:complete
MGLKKLTVDLSNGNKGGLAAYPLHNTSITDGGFNTDKSYTRIFDGDGFRQRSIPHTIENTNNSHDGKPFMVRKLPGINQTPGNIFDLPPTGEKTIDVDGNSVKVPEIDVPPFTTRFLDNITSGFIRGGIITAANRSLWDVIRIGKFMATPKGIAWSIKQRQLQKSNPKITEPTKNRGDANQRKWSFGANTLAQIAVSAFGGHVKREGTNPIFQNEGYEGWVNNISNTPQQQISVNKKTLKKQDNRLLYLFGNEIVSNTRPVELKKKEGKPKEKGKFGKFISKVGGALMGTGKYDTKLYSYVGGPGSTYGIGRTTIRKFPVANGTSFGHTLYDAKPWTRSTHGYLPYGQFTMSKNGGLSLYDLTIPNSFPRFKPKSTNNVPLRENSYGDLDTDLYETTGVSGFESTTYYEDRTRIHPKTQVGGGYSPILVTDVVDFRKLKKDAGEDVGPTTNYNTKVYGGTNTYHQENRVLRGNPGKLIHKGAGLDIFGQTTDGYNKFDLETIDKINALDIFKAQGNFNQSDLRDMIRFQIEAVNTNNPSTSNVMVFRALLDSLKDNYGSKWNTVSYNGRGEDFYIYDKFTRSVSFSFKIAAQSRHEMMPLYRKLNYLVSNTAPDYGGGTRMRGPYMKLTIGSWFDRVPGFFKSVNVSWKKNYPWEISISHLEKGQDKDGMVIMPHVLDVSCAYQPIHNFLPQKSINKSPFMMMHTNNRKIPNNMMRWYQPTIGNNIHPKDHEDEGKVDVVANISRAKIEGWQKIAKSALYLNDHTKPSKPDETEVIPEEIRAENYRTRDISRMDALTIKPMVPLAVDSPEIPMNLPYATIPEDL